MARFIGCSIVDDPLPPLPAAPLPEELLDLSSLRGPIEGKRALARYCRDNSVNPDVIIGRSLDSHIISLRREAVRAVAAELPHYSSTKLGQLFNRDHTTILNALGKLRARRGKAVREGLNSRSVLDGLDRAKAGSDYDCLVAIQNDPQLARARAKLSIHELRLIISHAKAGSIADAIAGIPV